MAIVLAIAVLLLGLIGGHAGRIILSEPPFHMVVEPANGKAVVQFYRPGKELVSPRFTVETTCEACETVVLRSPEVRIPNGSVEFCDTTLLPGRFVILFEDVRFDVMEARVYCNDEEFDWQKQ